MRLGHAAALMLMGWYLMAPSSSCAADRSSASIEVKAARIYAASENSKDPSSQGSDDSERNEIENEWYLMCPPFTTKPPGVAVNAPFTQWRVGTHWPDREVCEKQRAAAAQLATDKFANSDDEHVRIAAIALQHCRCFSSNDPRLDQTLVRKLKDFYLEEDYRHGLLKRPPK